MIEINWYVLFVILHIVGTAIGAGGATLSDILFFTSIKDGKITKSEFALLHAAGFAIWGGLAIIIASGVGMVAYSYYVNDVNLLTTSSKLQAKTVIVSVIILNGVFLHLRVFPLFKAALGKDLTKKVFLHHSSPIFTSGAVSIVSWYSAMIIGAWRGLSVSPYIILSVYFSIMIVAIIVAHIVGKFEIVRMKKRI